MRSIRLKVLPGWGLPAAVMLEYVSELSAHFHTEIVNLPGYGTDYPDRLRDMGGLVDALSPQIKQPCVLLGWSLGGMAALGLASELGDKALGVFLLASTPCFVNRPGWSHGVLQDDIGRMLEIVEDQPGHVLQGFAGLVATGDAAAQTTLRSLKDAVAEPPARPATLADGLQILMISDLRNELAGLKCPAALLLGGEDRLVHRGTAEASHALFPGLRAELIEDAGHAPFLSCPRETVKKTLQLLKGMQI